MSVEPNPEAGIIRIVLADDHALLRQTLAAHLNAQSDLSVIADVGDARAAVLAVREHSPDIVVMDIDMPGQECFQAARAISSESPGTRVIFLSAFTYDRYVQDALAAKAWGYLTKAESPDTVVKAIREVHASVSFFSPSVQDRIVVDHQGARLASANASRASRLTAREIEVLRYLARGLSKKEIAGLMHVSVKTVDNHVSHIMDKVAIHDRVELARFAIREGISEP